MSKNNVKYSVTRGLTVDDLLFMSNVFHMYSHICYSCRVKIMCKHMCVSCGI